METIRVRTLVIGSGCAGLNAADWLSALGETSLLLMTENMRAGTSRNTGSDKQTYYKVSTSGAPDSPRALAETLFGEGVQGDTALIEAACSLQCFYKLAQLGVPFPVNEYGEYVGYKTDHDPLERATSAGPLTSKYMAERLEAEVLRRGVPVRDHCCAFHILVQDGRAAGVLAYDTAQRAVVRVLCAHIILASGGPADVYARSVYPLSQSGMTGMALAAGAAGANLHQWQYGLASTRFRWNVSGSYQQVLPRYISVDAAGVEREFLGDYLPDPWRATFLKGYQWPFDVQKINGSSLLDLAVHRETTELNRRVYLDYRINPRGLGRDFDGLASEAREYLRNSRATQDTPVKRLRAMNEPAYQLYLSHGIDLAREPLEIAVCAQHHNGGLQVDAHWRTTLAGLYAVGEAAGTFGAYRPGGAALNATQVGSMRAAQHIAWESKLPIPEDCPLPSELSGYGWTANIAEIKRATQEAMSAYGAQLRSPGKLAKLEATIKRHLRAGEKKAIALDEPPEDFLKRLKMRDTLISQCAIVSAMRLAAGACGSSGAGLVLDEGGERIAETLPYRMKPGVSQKQNCCLVTRKDGENFASALEPVRPLPEGGGWFEEVWRAYRARTEKQED